MSKQGEKGISWTDETWNPIRGCSRVSEGCRNCYAERVASRFSGPGQPYEGLAAGGKWTGKTALVEDHLADPLRWTRPRRVFVNSMSDLFHEAVPDEWIDRIFAVMALARRHTFQILTKRPERMKAYLGSEATSVRLTAQLAALAVKMKTEFRVHQKDDGLDGFQISNVWLGVSVEDQATADERISLLLETPAAVRFVSVEPMLGPVDLARWTTKRREWQETCQRTGARYANSKAAAQRGESKANPAVCGDMIDRWLDSWEGSRPLDWIICGGESGPGARPMHPDWARSLRDQCQEAGVPFHLKQWGEWEPMERIGPTAYASSAARNVMLAPDGSYQYLQGRPDVAVMGRVGKKRAGRLLDGRIWDEFPGEKAKA